MKRRPELHVVGSERPSRAELARDLAPVRSALGDGAIDPLDHEALLALALGDEVLDEAILDEERREAEALARALDGEGAHPMAELAEAVKHAAAFADGAGRNLDERDHEALLARGLARTGCDEVALDEAILDEERREAEALARALDGEGAHPLAEFAIALRCAANPTVLSELTSERILRQVLPSSERASMDHLGEVSEERDEGARRGGNPMRAGKEVVRSDRARAWWPWISGLAAVAAGAALFFVTDSQEHRSAASAPLERPYVVSEQGRQAPRAAEAEADPKVAEASPPTAAPRPAGARTSGARAKTEEGLAEPRPGDAAGAPVAMAEAAPDGARADRGGGRAAAEPRRTKRDEPPESRALGEPAAARETFAAPPTEDAFGATADATPRAPRSTHGLFDPATPFAVRGGESDRLQRIVSARAADLRANRFARWGVR